MNPCHKQVKNDWRGFFPFERHPYALNPKKGYLASFNQMPERANFYGTAYFLFERPIRFEEMAKTKDRYSPAEIAAMQNDTGSYTARRFIPLISASCAKDASLARYVAMLEKWDRFISLESPEATLFNSFLTHLIMNTFGDELGRPIVEELYKDLHVSIPLQWLIRYLDEPENLPWDNASTKERRESRYDMIAKSMNEAVRELREKFGRDPKNWAWGRVHKMTIRHPLGGVLPFLNLGPYAYSGDDFTIHAGWWDRAKPFEMTSGAAIRIVVDMADLSTMTIMSPPGQSGHYLSPYYGDLAATWSEGKQLPAHYSTARTLPNVLRLEPTK